MRFWITLCFGFCIFCVPAYSQDWKTHYDQAVKLYGEGDYEASLAAAEKAYPYAKQQNPTSVAFTLQLITANYLQVAVSDQALTYSGEEVNLFSQIEGEKSKNYAEALKKQLSLLYAANKAEDAYAKSDKALVVSKSIYGESSYDYASILLLTAQIAITNNQFDKAKTQLDESLLLLEKNPEAGEDFLNALSLSGDLDVRLKSNSSAEKKYTKLLLILEQNGLQSDPLYTETKKNLDQLKISGGNATAATAVLASGTTDASLLAQSYLKLAIDFQQKGSVAKAFENYDLAKKAVSDGTLKDKTAFSIFLNATRYAIEKDRLDQARQDLAQTKLLSQQLFREDQAEYQIAQLTELDYIVANGKMEEVLKTASSSAAFLQSHPNIVPPSFVVTSAKRLLSAHQYEGARALLQPMVEERKLSETEQVRMDIPYCESLLGLGKTEEVVTFLGKRVESTQDKNVKTTYQIQLAETLRSKGVWSEALATLVKIQVPSGFTQRQAEVDYQKARLHQQLGQYREAEEHYRSAVKNAPKSDGDLYNQIENSLATFYTAIGNYEAAENIYEELLADKTLNESFRITVFQNLATVYQQTLRYKEAQVLLEQVVREDAIRLGENDPDYALSLQNLASVYQKTGDLKMAVELYTKALAIDEKVSGATSVPFASKAANLGVAQMELGDLTAASVNLSKALQIREKILGKDHPDYVFNEYNMAVLYQRQQKPELALPLYKHISSFYIKQIAELFPALSEKEKTAYYNKISEVVLAYTDFAIEQGVKNPALVGELLNFRLMTKALLLNASTKIRNRILSGNDPELKEKFTEWLQVKEELGKLYAQNQESKNQNALRIKALQQQAEEIEKMLSAKSELFAKSSNTEAITWQQLRTRLKPDEVAIEMVRLRLNFKNDSVVYAALAIRPDWDKPQMVIFPNGKSMEDKEFKFYRNATRFKVVNERSYAVYWQPLEKIVGKASTVYFSSDGVYNKINLASLFNKTSNQYLIDQYSFSILSNLKELTSKGGQVVTNNSATLLGSPDFGVNGASTSKSTLRSIVGTEFQPLPGTKVEVERIASLLRDKQWKVSEYISQEASEEKLKAIGTTGVLHIATHGFFVSDKENDSPVVFSENLDHIANNPLLRSGLILSGVSKTASETKEDGILTAYEAIGLPLDKTNLVILSACETGQGEVRNGEGVYGLQRAILLAGAQHLLMSLWKVDDEATQELMTEFYKQWLSTNDLKTAYRNAQLTLKAKYEMPQYWAGFVLLGI